MSEGRRSQMKTSYPNEIGADPQAIIFDCPDPEALAIFYARFLGGSVEGDPHGGFSVAAKGLTLGFQQDENYERPVFLGNPGDQQPMVHMDIAVANREKAVEFALSLGATWPREQFCQPDWDVQWTTLLDPAGHPFCLFEE